MRFLLVFFSFCLCAEQIQLGDQIISVEIADTPETQARGLMGRKKLAEGTGMLFVYEEPKILKFWMKSTLIPLSIAFFNEEKELIQIEHMNPVPYGTKRYPIYRSESEAMYALEVPQGWFEKMKIPPDNGSGMKFSFLDRANPLK